MTAAARQMNGRRWRRTARWAAAMCAAALAGCAGLGAQPAESQPGSAADRPAADLQRRAQIRLELAASYFQAGRLDVAMDEVGQALAIRPDYADAHGLLGLILMQNQDWAGAEAALRKAMELSPADGSQMHNYAWLQCRQRHFEQAQQWFDQALRQPRYQERARTLLARGICYQQAGQLEPARQSVLAAHELDAGNPVIGYSLANILWQMGDAKRAQFYARRLNNTEQSSAESLWLGIKIDRALHDEAGVRQLAEQLQRRFPQSRQWLAYERRAFNE